MSTANAHAMLRALSRQTSLLSATRTALFPRGFSASQNRGDRDTLSGDVIRLTDMVFYGYHGALPEEKTLGQRFSVERERVPRPPKGGGNRPTRRHVRLRAYLPAGEGRHGGDPFDLLEAAAEKIAQRILEDSEVAAVKLEIRKPSVPIPGALGSSAVQIVRYQRLTDG
jgi:dihydroneopterin aldolase